MLKQIVFDREVHLNTRQNYVEAVLEKVQWTD